MSQMMILFIFTAVRTSNPTKIPLLGASTSRPGRCTPEERAHSIKWRGDWEPPETVQGEVKRKISFPIENQTPVLPSSSI
jgi:hypothetical protein